MSIKDQIRAEIERLINDPTLCSTTERKIGGHTALQKLVSFLDTLPEQPECHTVEDWMQHIKNADQLTKDIFSKGPYDVLYDALNHPYQYCYDAIKEFGELCFQTGAKSIKPEQPAEGLLEEVDRFWANEFKYHVNSLPTISVVQRIARHFAEWGAEHLKR